VNSCGRCAQAYIVSQQGSIKLLSGLNTHYANKPIDIQLGLLWKHHQLQATKPFAKEEKEKNQINQSSQSHTSSQHSTNLMKCLNVEPQIAWEDPDEGGDGLSEIEE